MPSLTRAIALFIDDSAVSPMEMRSRARRVVREYNPATGHIVVDYLQLMQISTTENQ